MHQASLPPGTQKAAGSEGVAVRDPLPLAPQELARAIAVSEEGAGGAGGRWTLLPRCGRALCLSFTIVNIVQRT